MTFKKGFDENASIGNAICCEIAGFDIEAKLERSSFKPKLDEDLPSMKELMDAYRAGRWFFADLVLSISKDGAMLDNHAAEWPRVRCNYPLRSNDELTEMASALLPEAIARGHEILSKRNPENGSFIIFQPEIERPTFKATSTVKPMQPPRKPTGGGMKM